MAASMPRSRPKALTLTDAAAARIREIMTTRQGVVGLRIGVKKGGCAGMEYTIGLVTDPNPKDDRIERDGATVWVEPAAVLYLLGTEMDFEISTLRTGFTFHISSQYSRIARSEEKNPERATLRMDILDQRSGSR